MKTKRELAENQIRIQEAMQNAGFNVVNCGNCGTVLLQDLEVIEFDENNNCLNNTIQCFCGQEMDLSDCPDYWYQGCQDNAEFSQE